MIAIIPAHGYSRRLKNKHILPFCGIPLTAWSVIQSVCSHSIEETYVSTDDYQVAGIAESFGAKIIWRDYNQGPDDAANVPIMHAIKKIQKERKNIEFMVTLLPNGLLRKPEDIDSAVDIHLYTPRINPKDGWNFTVGLTNEPFVLIREKENAFISKFKLNDYSSKYGNVSLNTMVSDVKDYIDNSEEQRKILESDRIKDGEVQSKLSKFALPDFKYYIIEQWQHFHIDHQTDFDLCERLMETMILKGKGTEVYYAYARTKAR